METEAFERQQGKIEGSLQWTIFLVREGKSQAGWRQGGSRLKPVKAGTGISGTHRAGKPSPNPAHLLNGLSLTRELSGIFAQRLCNASAFNLNRPLA